MPISNYTTKVPASQTVGEIQQLLASIGCREIMLYYDQDKHPVKVRFSYPVAKQELFFALSANWEGVLKVMRQEVSEKRYLTEVHARNVAWRILKDWIEAQMAIVQAGLVQMEQLFLPYAVTRSGNTLYEEISLKLTEGKDSFLMLNA